MERSFFGVLQSEWERKGRQRKWQRQSERDRESDRDSQRERETQRQKQGQRQLEKETDTEQDNISIKSVEHSLYPLKVFFVQMLGLEVPGALKYWPSARKI